MLNIPVPIKFLIAVIFDVLDLLSVPILGTMFDGVGIIVGVMLWGPVGFWSAWEILEPTDQIDKFIPTLTLIGLYTHFGGKGK